MTLAAIAAVAVLVRVIYIVAIYPSSNLSGDALEFHFLARLLADGYGYVQPGPLTELVVGNAGNELVVRPDGPRVPTAEKPPLYPLVLSLGSVIDETSYTLQRLISAVLGAGSVILAGLIARRIASPRVGLIAAALAAVYPPLVLIDGSLHSESLYVLLVAAALLAALRTIDHPTWQRAAALGALIGLAALTRGEGVLLLALLAAPVIVWSARPAFWRPLLATLAAAALVLVPWVARNWITFDRPAAISTNEGGLLFGANCDAAYFGGEIGSWPCFPPPDPTGTTNEAAISARLRGEALDYAREHAERVPAVVAARVLRVWDLWAPPAGTASFEAQNSRHAGLQTAAAWSLYALLPFAVAGAWLLRRARPELGVLLVPVLMVTLVAALTYGTVRFRAAAEVSLLVLGALALERAAILMRNRAESRRTQAQ